MYRIHSYPFAILIFFSVVLFSGCIKDAKNVEVPKGKAKLVINCFISPQDTMLHAWIYKSQPIFEYSQGNTHDVITDATVELSDGTRKVTLLYEGINLSGSYYNRNSYSIPASSFPVEPGKTYFIHVTTPDGLSASASTTVPAKRRESITSKIDSINEDSDYYKEYRIDLSWQDFPGEANYYKIAGSVGSNECYSRSEMYFEGQSTLVSDVLADGGVIGLRGGRVSYGCYQSKQLPDFKIYLASVDINYYKYHRSRENYAGDDPFAEPVQIYTNVNGGLGIFGSFNMFVTEVKLE